jgi:hypothetical protein
MRAVTITDVQPRALTRLMQYPIAERLAMIAEGLELIAEHVATLRDDLVYLDRDARRRAMSVVASQSEEESAKALILLDIVRAGPRDQEATRRQIARFYDHLARCIYVDMSHMRPATFGEIRALVDLQRRSHYLDGPTARDWTFRNQLLTTREESMYVDLVHDEEGDRWSSPARYDSIHFGAETSLQDLVLALHRTGCMTRRGLDVIAEAWEHVALDDETHWCEASAANSRIVQRVLDGGGAAETVTSQDVDRVIDRWGFPMAGLDLSETRVARSELEAERGRLFAQLCE